MLLTKVSNYNISVSKYLPSPRHLPKYFPLATIFPSFPCAWGLVNDIVTLNFFLLLGNHLKFVYSMPRSAIRAQLHADVKYTVLRIQKNTFPLQKALPQQRWMICGRWFGSNAVTPLWWWLHLKNLARYVKY